jgi:oligoendopeptidase F
MAKTKYEQEIWNLDQLFTDFDAKEVQDAFDDIEQRVTAFEGFREKLSKDMAEKDFLEILVSYEQMARILSRLGGFASLKFAENTQDQQAQTFQAKIQQLGAEVENRRLFFKLWWKELDDEDAEKFMDASGDYRYFLEALRLEKPYTLSEPEEQVINLKDVNGPHALVTLYESITNRYSYNLSVNGEKKELTRGELSVFVRDPNPDMRKAAYQELHRVYEQDAPILGQIYQFLLRDWTSENVNLRKFSSPIAVRNLSNDIPDEVVDTLLEVARKNAPMFQHFYRLKAKWIGMDRIRRYDIYAPVQDLETEYDYDESVNSVLDCFAGFDPKIATLAKRVFDENHLDGEVRKGKMGGAFCATISPDLTPYVLQSFQGRLNDVMTMAHELGHAVHSMLAEDHNHLTQHASIPLAETASTFGEMLMLDKLLETDPDPSVRSFLLFRQLDDAYATIMRQSYFALFERTAHKMVNEGASVDELSSAYFENLQEQFGDSLELSEDFKHEWVAVPHFLMAPFYVYAYAFGQLLVLSLYQRFRAEGDSFKPGYLEILSAGGSDSPARILEHAGIDMHSAAFWQGGFDVIGSIVKQLEEIEVPAS